LVSNRIGSVQAESIGEGGNLNTQAVWEATRWPAAALVATFVAGTSVEVLAEPVEYVRVCDAYGAGFYYIPGTETCLRVGGYVGAQSHFIGDQSGLGTVVNPPDDSFFLQPSGSLTGLGIGGSVTFGTQNWGHTIGFRYSSANGAFTAEEPDGGENVGFVPGNVADGPGIDFGNFGFNATSELDTSRFGGSWGALRPYIDLTDGGTSVKGGFVVSLEGFKLQNVGHLERTPDPDNVFVDVELEHKGWQVGVGPKGTIHTPIGEGVSFIGSADVQAVVRRSSLSSWEYLCAGCGGTPIMYSVEDSLTTVGFQASANGMIAFRLPDDWRLKVIGGATVGDFHVVDVRLNPDDDSTHIAPQIGIEWNAGIRAERIW
jgi:hypothetical protein